MPITYKHSRYDRIGLKCLLAVSNIKVSVRHDRQNRQTMAASQLTGQIN